HPGGRAALRPRAHHGGATRSDHRRGAHRHRWSARSAPYRVAGTQRLHRPDLAAAAHRSAEGARDAGRDETVTAPATATRIPSYLRPSASRLLGMRPWMWTVAILALAALALEILPRLGVVSRITLLPFSE